MLHKTIRKNYLNNKNSNNKIYQIVKLMHGNIHTLKFQYTVLETKKYDKLKTTETDNGNYLSHDKRVIVVRSLLYTNVKSSIFLQNHIPKKLLAKELTLTVLDPFPVNPCLTVIEHCCLVLSRQVQALFSLEQREGDIPPNGRENSPGYVTQTTNMQNFFN